MIDNSNQKRAEGEMRESQEKLKAANHDLEIANQELEAFSYSVSHDLRQPLRAIEGYAQIISDEYSDRLDDEAKKLFASIRSNTRKMDHLITDLLALSRVSRSELTFSKINMTDLAKSMFEEIVPIDDYNQFKFSLVALPEAFGDLTLIRQVWSNLISNAIKYTRPKDPRQIEIGSFFENGMNVYYIKDNGVGFDPLYGHKLFGVFQRLHKASDFEGTGVGLAIIRRIINRHGGETWAEGQINHGATFYFSLPVKNASVDQVHSF
jgi:light-regulated signal transduction histidine kinase (bacteriophytochrome)